MTRTIRRRNPRGSGNLLREEILVAATGLIDSADDPAEVTLRRIAAATGIAAPSIYSHFDDLSAILQAVSERGWDEVVAQVQARADEGKTPRDRLLNGSRAYVLFAQQFPKRYALMTQTPGIAAAREANAAVTRGLLACDERPGRASAAVSRRVASALSAGLHGVAMLNYAGEPSIWLGDVNSDDVIRTLVDSAIGELNRPRVVRS